ncbi:ribonuclease P protein subunit p38 [Protobothrops mucrosquamatus]|uniref:ribonuclease P protein subunit p38 n=1 Tax=Protobothrops mucrosquamatus TaxID=103944 RepID=UPI000775B9C2|nr:ribonuclease P protein subunit p38 [Protobothrops mucrosquamatus]XP_015666690.1 ribonuclease P protein subunit p38 [Protobothrops mucrosquamatus]XP_015666692.1 ribonuclease P protein subunit p38 [Protobothrops mucrosquamatus]XP_015666693.1 ribonuclease P protein subunit p38 [Protobothrops mucrosquamatus]
MSVLRGKGSARKSKQIVKTSLNNPYIPQWCTLPGEDMHFVLQALEEVMKQIGFKKIEDRKRMKSTSRKRQKEEERCNLPSKFHEDKETDDPKACGWSDVQIRNQLAIGINEVTRALEKNELCLVLVCKSAKPALLTSHLIPLSASRAIPAGQVPRLSVTLAPVLGLTSVLALGFKRTADVFAKVLEIIIPRIPNLDLPWMQHEIEPLLINDTNVMTVSAAEFTDSTPVGSSFSHKRKLADNRPLASPTIALQTLKVKNVVPNPKKCRKLPKTKKRISKQH